MYLTCNGCAFLVSVFQCQLQLKLELSFCLIAPHSFRPVTMESASPIHLEYQGRVAIITIDNDKKLNALSQSGYYDLAQKLREVATHDEVFITLLIGKGRFFSA